MALSAKQIEFAKPGTHPDGHGLYLRVKDSGAKSWMYRYQITGIRKTMGLGGLTDLSAPAARTKALEYGELVRRGVDPRDELERRETVKAERMALERAEKTTFRMVAEEYIAGHRAGWRNAKHGDQWTNTLKTYAFPVIGDKPVGDVTTEDVLRILQPIWTGKTETASRVRSRMELVLSYAKAKKLRQGENPALWRGHLDMLLPPPKRVKAVAHHPALDYRQIPLFMSALRAVSGSGARALEFAILTGCRSGEVRLATWGEINLETKLWIIPAHRMKAKKEHRVPLSRSAMRLLEELPRFKGVDYVFPGSRDVKPLSDMTLSATIRRMNEGDAPPWREPVSGNPVVPHGFRSTFRDWAGETTSFPREVVEHALAHQLKDKAEAAYARGTQFEKRRMLMEAWARWCDTPSAGVIPLQGSITVA